MPRLSAARDRGHGGWIVVSQETIRPAAAETVAREATAGDAIGRPGG
jgi:hypothetical protein